MARWKVTVVDRFDVVIEAPEGADKATVYEFAECQVGKVQPLTIGSNGTIFMPISRRKIARIRPDRTASEYGDLCVEVLK